MENLWKQVRNGISILKKNIPFERVQSSHQVGKANFDTMNRPTVYSYLIRYTHEHTVSGK